MKQGIWLILVPISCGLIAGIGVVAKQGADAVFGQLLTWILGAGLVFILAYFVLPALADADRDKVRLPDNDFKVRMHRIARNAVRFSGNGKSVLAVADENGEFRVWRLDERARPVGSPLIPNPDAARFGKSPYADLGEYIKEHMLKD